MRFILDLWTHYRPRAVKLAGHCLDAASVYVGLYVFELMKHFLPISGWSANAIDNIHAAGSVVVLVIFTLRRLAEILPTPLRKILPSSSLFFARKRK